MVKRLSLDDASPDVKSFLNELRAERGEYVLEMGGKPVVGVVPPWQVEKLSREREEILTLLRQSWERNRTVPEEEVEQTVAEVIREVRREKEQGRP